MLFCARHEQRQVIGVILLKNVITKKQMINVKVEMIVIDQHAPDFEGTQAFGFERKTGSGMLLSPRDFTYVRH
ncbi:hypothetical protein E3I90_01160 [Candidatus Bathyarchaeota archaeon]|nr:MAG: hypothetical protein E3I90_01160 [Candidatus Bathyarchaeota archaeon]